MRVQVIGEVVGTKKDWIMEVEVAELYSGKGDDGFEDGVTCLRSESGVRGKCSTDGSAGKGSFVHLRYDIKFEYGYFGMCSEWCKVFRFAVGVELFSLVHVPAAH